MNSAEPLCIQEHSKGIFPQKICRTCCKTGNCKRQFFTGSSFDSNLVSRLLGLDSDTFYIYHVAAVMVDNLRRLLLGINLSDKAIMDFDFPGVGFPV